MNILLSTSVFKPMVGGIEILADNLAYHFTKKGHNVTVVTPIEAIEEDDSVYEIVRKPSLKEKIKLVRKADIVYSNGTSLYMAFWALLFGKKFVWTHQAYQISCIDGLGWHNGQPAPMNPWKSFIFHLKNNSLYQATRGILKVIALRWVAKNYASKNVAISDWMKNRQPLPNQIRIHNPFPIDKFKDAVNTENKFEYDFIYLGRLVSEKGVNILIKAFALLNDKLDAKPSLSIIGRGDEMESLKNLTKDLGLTDQVFFQGSLSGERLIEEVSKGKIAVVPSAWEEPFGGVATELMSAGKNIIVSKRGALAELVLDAGLTFENGDSEELAEQMYKIYTNPDLQENQKAKVKKKLLNFSEDDLIDQYLNLFERVLGKRLALK